MWPLIAADFAVVLVVFIIVFVHLVLIDGRIVIIIATERLVVLHVFILGNTGRFECGCRHLSRNVSGRLCRQRSRQLDAAYWAGSTNCTEPNRARQLASRTHVQSSGRRCTFVRGRRCPSGGRMSRTRNERTGRRARRRVRDGPRHRDIEDAPQGRSPDSKPARRVRRRSCYIHCKSPATASQPVAEQSHYG
ncbi:hypothetical protein PBRA_003916 [Plasmodiophora brassicae]|uniref:Uncharacterized protein n=1 Tax=Plasmodiophora brassicae TaxID=37360 RepID=A0A0G4IJ95_PLABS|nr:hypothetical protein PBRA_003916 [Plasmodiophora brassicae]